MMKHLARNKFEPAIRMALLVASRVRERSGL
jgi:hypothetical protein